MAGFNYSERVFSEKVTETFELKNFVEKESLLSFAWESPETNYKKTFFDQRLSTAQQIAASTTF